MRRNLILFLAVCSLVFLWSALGFAQCVKDTGDHGTIDNVVINCTSPDRFAADSAVVSFDLVFTTDALANDIERIVAWNAVLRVSATMSARVVVDERADGAVFGGTASGSPNDWEARFNSAIPPSGILPAVALYGAAQDLFPPPNSGPSLTAGTHILAHVVVVVYDTGCITIDTTRTQTQELLVVTNKSVGYKPCWGGPYTCCVEPCEAEVAPTCDVLPAVQSGLSGSTIHIDALATDTDPECCFTFVSCTADILENPASEAGATYTGTCGAGSADMNFDWPTGAAEEDTFHVVFTFTTDCGEVVSCTAEVNLVAKCLFATIGAAEGSPGSKVQVPITIDASGTDVGGFTFCIEYDPVTLTFVSLERGNFFDEPGPFAGSYKWHYLVWRNQPSTVIHKFKLCVVGIGKLYYYEGKCLPRGQNGTLLATFRLASNELYRCFISRVTWERLDPECIVNAFSDCSGNVVNVPDDPEFFDPNLCPGQYPKAEVRACARLNDGGVIFRCKIDPLVRGDINVNGFAYEIGDAVLFANYFLSGIGVFSSDPDTRERQINATDINADGLTLSVADLVFLLRILSGDAAPLGGAKLTPLAKTVDVTYNGRTVKSKSPVDLGAAWFVFKGEATKVVPSISGVEVKWNISNGETRVLVYGMHKGDKIPAGTTELFKVHGDLETPQVEAAEYYGAPVEVVVSAGITNRPTAFGLSQNYPNPFNASTTIRFALPDNSDVSLRIYNVAGQLVREYKQHMNAGFRSITWDGTNAKGEIVASGVYFYKLQAADFTKTLKMTLLK